MSRAGAHGNSNGNRAPGKPAGPLTNGKASNTTEIGSGARFPSGKGLNVMKAETMEPRHADGSRTGQNPHAKGNNWR